MLRDFGCILVCPRHTACAAPWCGQSGKPHMHHMPHSLCGPLRKEACLCVCVCVCVCVGCSAVCSPLFVRADGLLKQSDGDVQKCIRSPHMQFPPHLRPLEKRTEGVGLRTEASA
jgi:hypothetical protein